MTEYNPDDHTVEEVKEYVDQNPAEARAILEKELEGENRVTLVEPLQKIVDEQPTPVQTEGTPAVTVEPAQQDTPKDDEQAPTPAEAPAVTVEPVAAPTMSVLGKEYSVDPDRGYRQTSSKDYTQPMR